MPLAPLHPDFAARATLIAEQVRAAHCSLDRAVVLIHVSLTSAYTAGETAADYKARNSRHAERDAQIAAVETRLANDPLARARMDDNSRALQLKDIRRANAEANHDYVEGFEEQWADEYASIKRGL